MGKNNSACRKIHVVLFLKFQLVVAEIGTGAGIGTGSDWSVGGICRRILGWRL